MKQRLVAFLGVLQRLFAFVKGKVFWVRFGYFGIGLAISVTIWEVAHGAVLPWQPNAGLLLPQGGEWLELGALASAYLGATQVWLFLQAAPAPVIEVYGPSVHGDGDGAGRLWRLKESEDDDQRNLCRRPNPDDKRDSYAILHVQVRNPARCLVWEALHARRTVFGAQVRFRYQDLGSGSWFPPDAARERWLLGRWDANPEPLELSLLATNRQLDALHPTGDSAKGEREPYTVSFLVAHWGDPNLYHFNDEAYVPRPDNVARWCRPNLALLGKLYKVHVRLTGQGLAEPVERTFELRKPDTWTEGVTTFKDVFLKDG